MSGFVGFVISNERFAMLMELPASAQAQQQLEKLDREAARLELELRTGLAAANAVVRTVCKPADPA